MQLKNKTVLVTGGASGLGEATVRRLHQEGSNVVIIDFDEKRGKALEEELKTNAVFVKCNVVEEADVENAIKIAVDKFGEIHGVVNCAGVGTACRVVGAKGAFPLKDFKYVNQNTVNSIGVLWTSTL